MTDPGKRERKPARWLLIVAGWVVALGFSAVLIAIRAPHVQTMDRLIPFLITPVWLVSLALVSIGTFRVTRFLRNTALRVLLTALAVSAQCFAYYLILVVLAFYIHLWAGGQL